MLLPHFLDLHPGLSVLDLCGAGGSRAAPIVERMLDKDTKVDPCSVVVINEPDAASASKAARVVSQTVGRGANTIVVTAHRPEEFPALPSPPPHSYSDLTHATISAAKFSSSFDRVLCAVPCSGDGLIRKYPEKWRCWNPATALSYHRTQIEIAQKALELLHVRRMFPSTIYIFTYMSIHPFMYCQPVMARLWSMHQ